MLQIGPELFGDRSVISPCCRFRPCLTQLPHRIHRHHEGRLEWWVEKLTI